ncbi:MAG: GNAT family N-acetyltransferase [Limisphaerales bacterium]
MIRPARNSDREAIIEIIDTCLREIGDRFFPEGEGQDLLDVDAAYTNKGGAFVVLEKDGQIIGTHATSPVDHEEGIITFRRLYLKHEHRRQGHGYTLMKWAIEWSIEQGWKQIVFWSDTRFRRAHEFFETFGFVKGETRDMDDGAMPYSEHRFQLGLKV